MRVEQDYRSCVTFSLCVMHQMRVKIYQDVRQHDSVIYNGLHEFESENVRNLYFQEYEMEWFDSHWNALESLLKQNGCMKSEQKEKTLFFATYFAEFLPDLNSAEPLAKVAVRELVAAKKKMVEEMIDCADQWEERNNQLKVDLKKHKEYFKRLIENSKKNAKEEM